MSRLVTIGLAWDIIEAAVVLSALRASGFHVSPGELNHLMMNPVLPIALGGVRIQVPAAEAHGAAELLRDARAGQGAGSHAAEIRAADEREGYLCPGCQSGDYFRLRSWLYGLIFTFSIGVPANIPTGELLCRACGHRWRPQERDAA